MIRSENEIVSLKKIYSVLAAHFKAVNRFLPFSLVHTFCITTIRFDFVFVIGGHEWQVVAEGLGLTPLEIRFLDSRTLNPFDAALSFIARQRHITVGNLYDLLKELGFPVIADRRLWKDAFCNYVNLLKFHSRNYPTNSQIGHHVVHCTEKDMC